ncbi:hypothetical protein JW933_11675 [candidate division FCPU426 bacterium]|nr:hypothetical protein [candidate division FCPU426 bacterium]
MATSRRKPVPARDPSQEPQPAIAKRKMHTRPLLPSERAATETGLFTPRGWVKWLAYLTAFFPPSGLVLGIFYYSQPHPEARRFGQKCLALAGLGLVALCCCWGLLGIFRIFSGIEPANYSNGYF